MEHGSIGYFEERRHNVRRLSLLSLCVGLALLAPIVLLRLTPLGRGVRNLDVMRFGFSGPPRYVELMQVDAAPTDLRDLRDVGRVNPDAGRRGAPGPKTRRAVEHPAGKITPRRAGDSGEAGADLLARAIANRGAVPVMQSEDLVFEKLVRPEYPEEARSHGVEGHVAVLARVDTLGFVAEAEIMTPSGEAAFDVVSRNAVMACRFRPFMRGGKVSEVFAVFRFAFRIY